MSRAAAAIDRIARALGLEGAFLLAGTLLLAAAASFVHPAGPLLVMGAVCLLLGIALALPVRKG